MPQSCSLTIVPAGRDRRLDVGEDLLALVVGRARVEQQDEVVEGVGCSHGIRRYDAAAQDSRGRSARRRPPSSRHGPRRRVAPDPLGQRGPRSPALVALALLVVAWPRLRRPPRRRLPAAARGARSNGRAAAAAGARASHGARAPAGARRRARAARARAPHARAQRPRAPAARRRRRGPRRRRAVHAAPRRARPSPRRPPLRAAAARPPGSRDSRDPAARTPAVPRSSACPLSRRPPTDSAAVCAAFLRMSASCSSIQSPGSRAVTISFSPRSAPARARRAPSSAPRGSSRPAPGCRTG